VTSKLGNVHDVLTVVVATTTTGGVACPIVPSMRIEV